MRILLYGENWEGTHVDNVARILREKNVDHKIFDFFKMLSYHTPINIANRVLRRLFYKRNERLINKRLIEEINIYQPVVLLISKGVNIFPETLRTFKERSILVVNWNMDDFFNKLNSSQHLLASLGIYDYVFSPRPQMFDAYYAAGIKKIIFSESYYVPWLHKKPDHPGKLERRISFVGSYSKRRERVIEAIDSIYPIEIWGAGWGLSSLRTKKNIDIRNEVMKQADFPEMISKSLVNLNILTIENNDLTNLKVFEITACDGLLLTDYNEYTESILMDGALYYTPFKENELNEKLAYIFDPANMEEVRRIRDKGHAIIMNGHNTINDRVDIVLDVITKAIG